MNAPIVDDAAGVFRRPDGIYRRRAATCRDTAPAGPRAGPSSAAPFWPFWAITKHTGLMEIERREPELVATTFVGGSGNLPIRYWLRENVR